MLVLIKLDDVLKYIFLSMLQRAFFYCLCIVYFNIKSHCRHCLFPWGLEVMHLYSLGLKVMDMYPLGFKSLRFVSCGFNDIFICKCLVFPNVVLLC